MGSVVDHIADCVAAGDSVSVSSTSHLVVPEDVGQSPAFGTGICRAVEGDPQSVAEAATEFLSWRCRPKADEGTTLIKPVLLHVVNCRKGLRWRSGSWGRRRGVVAGIGHHQGHERDF